MRPPNMLSLICISCPTGVDVRDTEWPEGWVDDGEDSGGIMCPACAEIDKQHTQALKEWSKARRVVLDNADRIRETADVMVRDFDAANPIPRWGQP